VDYAYSYRDPTHLYLNVTNRCSNRCSFCVRSFRGGLGNGHLTGGPEPDLDQLLEAIEMQADLDDLSEIIWCGFGEPTFRLDLITSASPIFRAAGISVRLNTNGHACLIHGRDVLPELGEVIDMVSVSLNAPTCRRYLELCLPHPAALGLAAPPAAERFWEAMLDFLTRAPRYIDQVQASVVGHALDAQEISACQDLAEELGCGFRVR
jgi:TatD DNase family protein